MFLAFSAASLTNTQIASINQAAYQAMFDSIAELVTGKTSFDGFRLSEKKSYKDH